MGIVDRGTGRVFEEELVASGGFSWLYRSRLGRRVRPALFGSTRLHRALAWYADTRHSRRFIPWAVRRFGIDLSEARVPAEGYATFNAFFARELAPHARPFDPERSALVSPADAKLHVVPRISDQTVLVLKGCRFTLGDLLASRTLAARYEGGAAAIFRLYLGDCHRVYFPCDGVAHLPRLIPGRHEPISPVPGSDQAFYTRNVRQVTLVDTEAFGRLAFIEIGGFLVSSIEQRRAEGGPVRRAEEKSRFRFGGSACVLLSERGRLRYDDDLLRWGREGHEVTVKIGEHIAHATEPRS
jgi:phosphatidylserine decarboxylase